MYHLDSRPDMAGEQIQHANTMTSTVTQQLPPTPPWRSPANFKVDYVSLEEGKANYTSQELKTQEKIEKIEKIESYQVDYTIYTGKYSRLLRRGCQRTSSGK